MNQAQKPMPPKRDLIFCKCGAMIQRLYGNFFYNGRMLPSSWREDILRMTSPNEYERQKKNGEAIVDCPKCQGAIFIGKKMPLNEDILGKGKICT